MTDSFVFSLACVILKIKDIKIVKDLTSLGKSFFRLYEVFKWGGIC